MPQILNPDSHDQADHNDAPLLRWSAGASIAPAMNRRAFVTGLGAVLAAPLAAEEQQPSNIGSACSRSVTRLPRQTEQGCA